MSGHLDPEKLETLAEGGAPDGETAAHLEACAECSKALGDLQAYIGEMKALRRLKAPPGFAARLRKRVDAESAPGWKKAWVAAFLPWRVKIPLQLAGAGLATVLLFWAIPRQGVDEPEALEIPSAAKADEKDMPEPPRPPVPDELAMGSPKKKIATPAADKENQPTAEPSQPEARSQALDPSATALTTQKFSKDLSASGVSGLAKAEPPASPPASEGAAEKSLRKKSAPSPMTQELEKASGIRARSAPARAAERSAPKASAPRPQTMTRDAAPDLEAETAPSAAKAAPAPEPASARAAPSKPLNLLEGRQESSAAYISGGGTSGADIPADRAFDPADESPRSEADLSARAAAAEKKSEEAAKFSADQENALKALGFKAGMRGGSKFYWLKAPTAAWDSLKTRLKNLGLESRATLRALDAAPDSSEVEIH